VFTRQISRGGGGHERCLPTSRVRAFLVVPFFQSNDHNNNYPNSFVTSPRFARPMTFPLLFYIISQGKEVAPSPSCVLQVLHPTTVTSSRIVRVTYNVRCKFGDGPSSLPRLRAYCSESLKTLEQEYCKPRKLIPSQHDIRELQELSRSSPYLCC
jgi:hypothetical protein